MPPHTAPVLAACVLLASVTAGRGQAVPLPETDAPVRLRGVEIDRVDEFLAHTRVIGREEGDNGFRNRTPALARGRCKPLRVDLDALHDRKLRIYGEGAVYTAALPAAGAVRPPARSRAAPPRDPAPAPTPLWKWTLFASLVGLAACLARTAFGSRERPKAGARSASARA